MNEFDTLGQNKSMLTKRAAGSPCVDLCMIDETSGFCMGCWRTSEEIAMWDRFSPYRRTKILAELISRRKLGNQRHDKAG